MEEHAYPLTFITIIASGGNATVFLIFYPILLACQAKSIICTCCTSVWALHTFLSLFITIISIRAAIQAFALKCKTARPACNAL